MYTLYMKRTLRKPVCDRKARPFTVYLPESLERWLRQEAHGDGRTLSAQTVRVLEAGRKAMSDSERS